ncbi:sigma-70 family RNA polymerase sigma factor [Cohnella candidum]|uniref:Sigma-70 family RNA polymerase sigma factor n=1 Tax=Cohnella candidum TaxID=2674991 RepID=A0A3G3JV43_9BACL|nr:sigma-70 family RNA polymerase sigma factor [Cohnella candidum]AYQ72123.1 sigma-70 family RNA polymerase sigma factor [Cohnella candidum]
MDEELRRFVHAARTGSKEAFAELVRRFKGNVYRHAYGMLGSRSEAEDAAQEAFIKAYYSISRLDADFAFSSWMMRIVTNICLDRLKKRTDEWPVAEESRLSAAAARDEMSDTRMAIQEAMRQLSPEHRQVLLLHDMQGYRYEEISELLDIPLGTVKSRLNAARLALRKEWKKGEA